MKIEFHGKTRFFKLMLSSHGFRFEQSLGSAFEYEGISLIVHKQDDGWSVTAKNIGQSLTADHKTKAEAVASAITLIDGCGTEAIKRQIAATLPKAPYFTESPYVDVSHLNFID